MTSWVKTSQAVAILIILLMSVSLAVPPGLHFELCFGEGGHFDVSLDSCYDVPSSQRFVQCVSGVDQIHHGECSDLAIACDSFEEFLNPAGKVGLRETKIVNDTLPATVFLAGAFITPQPTSGNFSSFRLSRHTLPPSHLDSLRTVVLLI